MALSDPHQPIPNTPLWLGAGGLPPWYLSLRNGLTAVVVVCVGLAAVHGQMTRPPGSASLRHPQWGPVRLGAVRRSLP